MRNEDFQFLTASQKLILNHQNQLLHSAQIETQKARVKANSAKQKAQQWIGIGSAVLAASLVGAIGFSTLAYQRFKLAQVVSKLNKMAAMLCC